MDRTLIERIIASKLEPVNTKIRQLQGRSTAVSATMTKVGSQAVASAATPVVTWEAEAYDQGEIVDLANDRFVVVEPGIYIAAVALDFAANSTGARGVAIQTSGSIALQEFTAGPSAAAPDQPRVEKTLHMRLAAGDIVRALAYQSSGGALNVLAAETRFSLTRIGG